MLSCRRFLLRDERLFDPGADGWYLRKQQQAVTTGATNVTIVSADKDLAQLVTRRVNMLNVYTGERMGPEEVRGQQGGLQGGGEVGGGVKLNAIR